MTTGPGARPRSHPPAGSGPIVATLTALSLAAGCTGGAEPPAAPRAIPSVTASAAAEPARLGEITTAQARRAVCPDPGAAGSRDEPDPGPAPVSVREVERAIARIRGLSFREPVPIVQQTRAELVASVRRDLARSAPAEFLRRKTLVYRSIGLIGEDASLAEALRAFLGGQVAGFYVPETGQLVVVSQAGEGELDALGEATLAHELTHALDDQHFDIGRIAGLRRACKDERASAMTGAVEGSAQFFMTRYIAERLDLAELGSLALQQESGSLEDVPPFVVRSELWPYTAGQAFVTAIAAEGDRAVGEMLRAPPVSTEQVLHPDRYPSDVPQPVEVPDLGPALGSGEDAAWMTLDVEGVGEAWLATMLGLRLDAGEADDAAAGWDGGVVRSWGRDGEAVVVLRTVWDTPGDAAAFADALRRWLGEGSQTAEVIEEPSGAVSAVFASPGADVAAAAAGASLRAWAAPGRAADGSRGSSGA